MFIDINYIIYSIVGAILLPFMYFFSKNKQYKLCALIPAIPVLGLTGLFMLINYNANIYKYIKNHIKFLTSTILFYILLIFIFYLSNNIYLSITISILLWCIIVYNLVI